MREAFLQVSRWCLRQGQMWKSQSLKDDPSPLGLRQAKKLKALPSGSIVAIQRYVGVVAV